MSSDAHTDENLGKIIEVFKPYLLRHLNGVSDIMCLLNPGLEEVNKVASEIHTKDRAGQFAEASKILLGAISKSEQPGKWRMFIDALTEMGKTEILQTLLDETPKGSDPWLDNQENRQLIQLFSPRIDEHLRLEGLLVKLWSESLIPDKDRERLSGLIADGRKYDANGVLLMVMVRHSKDWYKTFLTILYHDDDYPTHRELAQMIDPGFCEKIIAGNLSSGAGDDIDHRPEAAGVSDRNQGTVLGANASQRQTNTHSLVGDVATVGEKGVGLGASGGDKKQVATLLPRPPNPSNRAAQPPSPSSSRHPPPPSSPRHPPPPSSPRSQPSRSPSSSSSSTQAQAGDEARQREATCAAGCTRLLEEVTSLRSDMTSLRSDMTSLKSEVSEIKQLLLRLIPGGQGEV